MEQKKGESDFTLKLQKEIMYIRSYLFSKMDEAQKARFCKLEKFYDIIVQ